MDWLKQIIMYPVKHSENYPIGHYNLYNNSRDIQVSGQLLQRLAERLEVSIDC